MRSDDINFASVSSFMEREQFSSEISNSVNFEQVLYQTLVNDGEHIRLLNGRRPQFTYNEKQLRDAAAAEVGQHVVSVVQVTATGVLSSPQHDFRLCLQSCLPLRP